MKGDKFVEKKKYCVKVIHEYTVEAESYEEAEQIALDKPYSEARDCYLDVEEVGE